MLWLPDPSVSLLAKTGEMTTNSVLSDHEDFFLFVNSLKKKKKDNFNEIIFQTYFVEITFQKRFPLEITFKKFVLEIIFH